MILAAGGGGLRAQGEAALEDPLAMLGRHARAIVGDPDVTQSLSFDTRSKADQADCLTKDVIHARTSEPRPDYYLAIANEADTLIGFARVGLGGHRGGELGYAVRRDHWGKGIATEAASLMLSFGFHRLGLQPHSGRLWAG